MMSMQLRRKTKHVQNGQGGVFPPAPSLGEKTGSRKQMEKGPPRKKKGAQVVFKKSREMTNGLGIAHLTRIRKEFRRLFKSTSQAKRQKKSRGSTGGEGARG